MNRNSSHGSRLRVGAVSYLNTRPLIHDLQRSAPDVVLSLDLPSRLADQLATAQLDVALIPSIEYFQDPAYSIVSDACIGCRGPVLSVKLLSRVPLDQIRTLALDEGSRTSVALTRILLRERFGLAPRLERLPIGSTVADTSADAILLIGDRAIHPPADRFVAEWDLGEEWGRWSGLPFVFAMWVARPGIDIGSLDDALGAARDSGLQHLEAIAAAAAAEVRLPAETCLSYLRDNLYFYLGPRELEGLDLFRTHAIKLGLAPADAPRAERLVRT
ncbi:MAG TPA: menaquinone biosynthesis protein [Pirellulaceae bacterium]|nr:menaquinone biosynthesis protein [Pirellulaceae bacterium]